MRLLLPEEAGIKENITVLLFPRDTKTPITIHCNVVWCKRCEKDNYMIGLKFLKIKEKDRFVEFLCEKLIDFSFNEKVR